MRQLLLDGSFAAAADRLRQLSPQLAANPWLEFQLKRHEFMHMALAGRVEEALGAQYMHSAAANAPTAGGA